MLYLAPRQSHLFIWRFLPVSCPSDPRPALKRQVTLFHTEVSESLSPVSCHAAAQASPSLALSAVERVRFNLKLILHPLCPEMDVKNELITTEASAIETSPAFPPNRGWRRQSTFSVSLVTGLSDFPLVFAGRQAGQIDWGKGKGSQHPERALGGMSPAMLFANHLLLQILALCLCYNWSMDLTTSRV